MKFPLNSIYFLFHSLIQKYKENKYRNQFEKDNLLFKEIRNEMLMSFNLHKGKNNITKCNINKKLTHLIKISAKIVKTLIKDKQNDLINEDELLCNVSHIFLKKSSGSYLRMEEIEELFCYVHY